MGETFRVEIPINIRDNTDPGVSQATRRMNAFDRTNQRTQERLERMNRTKYQVVVDALDKASSVVQRIGMSVKGVAGKAWSITMRAVDLATAPIRGIINLLKNPIFQIGAAIGITIGLKDAIDTFATFEQSMANAAAVSGATGEELQKMTNLAREMGRATRFSAREAADAMYYMASAGYKAADMESSLASVLKLASATHTELAATTDTVIATLNMFQLKSGQASRVADVFAASIGNSQATMDKLTYSLRYAGPVAHSLGYSLEETTAALSLLYNTGYQGEQAGTILRGALSSLLNPTSSVTSTLRELGLTYSDVNPATKSLAEIIGVLNRKSVTTAQAMALFGTEAGPGMIALIGEGQEKLEEYIEILENAQGAADKMAATMDDTLAGAFDRLKSATDDVKITIGERLKPHLARFTTWLTQKMPGIEKAAGKAMDFIDEKIAWLSGTVNEFMSGEDWEKADIWGKIKIAWDKIVAEPFSQWWNSTGKTWLGEKAKLMGNVISGGISFGILALLGVDTKGAASDGVSIGASFAEGFKEGFEGAKVGEAILNSIKGVFRDAATLAPGGKEASSTSWLSAALVGWVGAKLAKLIYNIAKGGATLWSDIKGVFGKGSKDGMPTGGGIPSAYTTTTMAVKAQVVNVYGTTVNSVGNALKNVMTSGAGAAGGAALGAGGSALLLGKGASAAAALPGATTLALPGATAAAGTAAGTGAVINTVQLASGTYVASGGALTTGLANTGVLLGSGATTTAGAAAVGAGSILGAIGGLLGIGSGAIDIYKGATSEDAPKAKERYWSGGTKLGMVGAGAASGAGIGAIFGGIGAVPGALIGAGVGGIGALLGGNKAGAWASETWESVKSGASDARSWITDKWSDFGSWFETSVWTPAKDIGISAINIAAGAWETAKQAISEAWAPLADWFDSNIWLPVKEGARAAGQWVSDRWNDAKSWVSERWSEFSGWFDETVWTPVKSAAQTAGAWLGEQFTVAKNAVSEAWSGVSGWFEKNVWGPIKTGATEAWNWVGEKLDGIGEWIGDKWTSFKDWLAGLGQKGSKSTGLTTSQGKATILEHAWGGIITKPHMGIVAEDGAEGIIPLSPSKRGRAIDLWQRVGEILGARPYENGGIAGDIPTASAVPVRAGTGNVTQYIQARVEKVEVHPAFHIEGDNLDEENVVTIIKGRIREMADDIGDELAERLARVFANMPVKGGAGA